MLRVWSARGALRAAAMLAAILGGLGARAVAEERAYDILVSDVTAKVGEPAVMQVTLKIRDGYRILKHYNNRVFKLSSFDDGVAFENKMALATMENDALVFHVALRATKPGKHAINGLLRVGYILNENEFAEVTLPLIANVTGAP